MSFLPHEIRRKDWHYLLNKELAAFTGMLLVTTAMPFKMSGADLPLEYAPDSRWPKAIRVSGAPGVTISSRRDSSRAWWAIFADPVLDRLENIGLAANQDLQEALGRVTEARMRARVAAADFFPHLQATANATRQRVTDTGPVLPARLVGSAASAAFGSTGSATIFSSQVASSTYNEFQAPLELSYEIDFFGRIRHNFGQARATAGATEAERQAVELSLSAEVATAYFNLRASDSKVEVLRHTVELRLQAAHLQQKRLDAGLANKLDYLRAEVELENTDADLNDAVRERAEGQNALAALCGQDATTFQIPPDPLGNLTPPAAPGTLPSSLLAQRPDLIEAEKRLAAASEGIGMARANLFPTVNVQGNYGYDTAQFDQLFDGRSRDWSISASVSIPIFEGGRNAANLRAARARRDEALAAYRRTAVTAFKEAENAMIDLRQRISQNEARERAESHSKMVMEGSEKRYLEGAVSYFEVIDAQRVFLNAQLSRVQTLNARFAAIVDIIRAFGGPYTGPDGMPSSTRPVKLPTAKNPHKIQ